MAAHRNRGAEEEDGLMRCSAVIIAAVVNGLSLSLSALPAKSQSSALMLPSFDCAKAATHIERAICADPDLARWDGRMGQAFKNNYAQIDGNQRRFLLEAQRVWIALRKSQCDQPELDPISSKQCILRLTEARVATLEASVVAGSPTSGTLQDGDVAYRRGDYATALKCFRPLAERGDATAQTDLGAMYVKGQGVARDYAEAVRWYRKATDQGYAIAQFNLGGMYVNGLGVPQDYALAADWFRKAADQGYAAAQSNLGVMYQSGQGMSTDYAEAVKWFRKAADQGYADAQNGLGFMYANGQGVAPNFAEAVKWYRKAAEQGNVTAQSNLADLYARFPALRGQPDTTLADRVASSPASSASRETPSPQAQSPPSPKKEKKYPASIVPVEADAVLYKDGPEDIDLINKLVTIVRANDYMCESISAARPTIFSRGFELSCDRFAHKYDITDKGGHWIVTVN
ncbi:MAG: lysozyme inhibitor LprI family protein [Beijerinckiaceae bacterium]